MAPVIANDVFSTLTLEQRINQLKAQSQIYTQKPKQPPGLYNNSLETILESETFNQNKLIEFQTLLHRRVKESSAQPESQRNKAQRVQLRTDDGEPVMGLPVRQKKNLAQLKRQSFYNQKMHTQQDQSAQNKFLIRNQSNRCTNNKRIHQNNSLILEQGTFKPA